MAHRTEDPDAAAALARRLLADLPELAATVGAHLVAELPLYRRLPAEEMAGDVRRTIEQTIRGIARLLRDGGPPSAEHRGILRASAAKRAEEGVPVGAVVEAYYVGARACFDSLAPRLPPEQVSVAYSALLDYLSVTTAEVTTGYLEERQALIGETGAARQSLMSALLDGADVEATARRTGIAVPQRFLVLALRLGLHPDEQLPDVDASVAARRKVRRIRTEIERQAGQSALVQIANDQGLVLLPDQEDQGHGRKWLSALVAALARESGVEILAGVAEGAPENVPEAARLAGQLRDLASRFGREPGVYGLDDLLIEYQLSRPGPARERLTALLEPVAGKPDLMNTLQMYLASNLDRRLVAKRQHVHPNTVDYRIHRVRVLTGLDPTNHRDRLTLTAALAARAA